MVFAPPDLSHLIASVFHQCNPVHDNQGMRQQVDRFGVPIVNFDFQYDRNDRDDPPYGCKDE